MRRRDFLTSTGGVLAGASGVTSAVTAMAALPAAPEARARGADHQCPPHKPVGHAFNRPYQGEYLNQVAFPLGGIGAGMFCVEGNGALSKFSFRHRPDLEREHQAFAAIAIQGQPGLARILEGPVPAWKLRPQFPGQDGSTSWGLPRFHEAIFEARFPFATVHLTDPEFPVETTLTAWSPFSPGDADNASLPVAGLEYSFVNRSKASVNAVFSLCAENILAPPPTWPPTEKSQDWIHATPGGFILYAAGSADRPWDEGSCAFWLDAPHAVVNHAWMLDSLDILWRSFASGEYAAREPLQDRSAAGASVFVPFTLGTGEARTLTVRVAWYVPRSDLFEPTNGFRDGKYVSYALPAERYQPWYAGRFAGIQDVIRYWNGHYSALRQAAQSFSQAFFDSTLPPEAVEAVAANLSILKSPTVLRQTDGRLWGWEGSMPDSLPDVSGTSGTTTHVWNYAQSIPHLFPTLERTLRETEFGSNQNDDGLQYCRTPLPIRPVEPGHTIPDGPAADGQLGAIMRVYRDWRICGDHDWLRRMWPRVRASLDYCIRTWDPAHRGCIEEPHLTTYDAEFWGADSFCTSLYLGALKAATLMAEALGQPVETYPRLLALGMRAMETQLFNGEYFFQNRNWKRLQASFPPKNNMWERVYHGSPELQVMQKTEGPCGQYWTGCLSDGVMGIWLAHVCGLDAILNAHKVEAHLGSVHRYNFRKDLKGHANLMRVSFAVGEEAGLLACTWPKGGRPSIPMEYSDEVWTGIEYQVASHLIALGNIDSGLDIVRAVRRRYDGRIRNPFCEIEMGYWYARAMSSYALLQAFSGARYDAVDKVLYLRPALKGDFRCFLATATGYGTVGVKNGQPFVEVVIGEIAYTRIEYTATM